MLVNIKVNSVVSVDIDEQEAFMILCKTLQMEFALDDRTEYFVHKNDIGINCVYCVKDGQEFLYDSRGDLFVAIRNVAVNLFPDTSFRDAPYIYSGDS